MLDLFGPLEMFGMTNKVLKSSSSLESSYVIKLVHERGIGSLVKANEGPLIQADLSFSSSLKELQDASKDPTIHSCHLFIPGGAGTRTEISNVIYLITLRVHLNSLKESLLFVQVRLYLPRLLS